MISLEMNHKVRTYLKNLPENKNKDFELRMSNAGMCPRLIDYSLRDGVDEPDAQQSLRMSRGRAIHNMWQPMLHDIYGDGFKYSEQELQVPIGEYVMTGHPDGYIEEYDALYELKSIGTNTYRMVENQDHPIPAHFEQANLYAHVLKASNCMIHYFDPGTCDSLWFLVPYSFEAAKRTIDKFEQAYERHEKGMMLKRPYVDPTESPCWFCYKKGDCYKGWGTEVDQMQESQAETQEDLWMQDIHDTARRRLRHEKDEKVLKKQLAESMLKREVSSIQAGNYKASVKLGKNGNPLVKVDLKA